MAFSDDIIKTLRQQSPGMIVILMIAYFGKSYLEKKIESVQTRIDRVSASSLKVKTDLRGKERDALVEFHQVLTGWEHFLISAPTKITTDSFDDEFSNRFYNEEDNHLLEVKKASAKLSVLLSDRSLDGLVFEVIAKVQRTYHPVVNEMIMPVIDLRSEAQQIDERVKAAIELEQNGKSTPELVQQAQQDFQRLKEINKQLTDLAREAAKSQLEMQKPLRELMEDLKIQSQALVYRALKSDQVGEE